MNFPSVTEILRPWADFSMVRPDVLEHAAERGTRVHAACAAHAQELWVPPLPDEIAGYFDSFKGWFEYVDEVVLIEGELVDAALGFCGHPDIICRMKGDSALTIVDYKTPVTKNRLWAAQLATYKHLAEVNGYHVHRIFSLRLSKDGKRAKVDEYLNSPRDFAGFINALNAWKYFKGE